MKRFFQYFSCAVAALLLAAPASATVVILGENGLDGTVNGYELNKGRTTGDQ